MTEGSSGVGRAAAHFVLYVGGIILVLKAVTDSGQDGSLTVWVAVQGSAGLLMIIGAWNDRRHRSQRSSSGS